MSQNHQAFETLASYLKIISCFFHRQQKTKKMMKNKQEQINFYQLNPYQHNYRKQVKHPDPQLSFQRDQSAYGISREGLTNKIERLQQYDQNKSYRKSSNESDIHRNRDFNSQRNKFYNEKHINEMDYRQGLRQEKQRSSQISLSKPNCQMSIVSGNKSLEYLSSQEPSFSSKGEFSVIDNFNSCNQSVEKIGQKSIVQTNTNTKYEDWQLASFAPKSNSKLALEQKLMRICEFVQELKFMKEGLQSKLKQQKVYFVNQIQEVKKVIFRLNIKYEKQIIEFSKNNLKQSRQSSFRQSIIGNEAKQNQLNQLRIYCKKLQEEKMKAEQKYQSTLRRYQQEIQIISEQFQRRLIAQRNSNLYSNQEQQRECMNCMRLEQEIQNHECQSPGIQIWKGRLIEQRQQHGESMKRLEQQLLSLQWQFQNVTQSKLETQKLLKEKEKQISYRETQIQYRLKDIEKRQRDLQMSNIILQKQKSEIEKIKEKIADYEFKILKQQRKQKNQLMQNESMASQYFDNCQKRKILSKVASTQLERSDSISSKNSRIDISARLKEIQMLKIRGSRNYQENQPSRNSSKDSRLPGLKNNRSSRVLQSTKNLRQYGMGPAISPQRKYGQGDGSQSIKLSQKLNRLTQTLESELRQMN